MTTAGNTAPAAIPTQARPQARAVRACGGRDQRERASQDSWLELHLTYSPLIAEGAFPPDPGTIFIPGGLAQRLVTPVHYEYRCGAYCRPARPSAKGAH